MSFDNTKLYELVEKLAPNDLSLLDEVRLAVDDPADYVRRFRERLALRGISKPEPGLPWIALVDGLAERSRVVEFDWKEDPGAIMDGLDDILGEDSLDWDSIITEDEEELPCEEFLQLVGRRLRERGLALVCIDIQSDCYPVLAVPIERLGRVQQLSAESGYGKIEDFAG
jgi:hypothetical protein